jgi:cytochrome P450
MSGIGVEPAAPGMGDDAFDAMGQFTNTVAGDLRDPYPGLGEKRRAAPVELAMQTDFDGGESPVANVYTYDTVAQVLRDNVTFSSGAIRELMELVMGPFVLVGMDEPEHKRHRALVSAAFRHKSLVRWETEVIDPIMHDLIDRFAERGSAELVREFTFRFPVQIIAEILGVPHEDHEKFHDMAIWVVNVAANPEKGIAASHALREYLAEIVETKRAKPGDDVISLLVQEELDGERLDDEEIYSFLRLLLPAGAETTYRATGSFLFGLLSNPDQLDALRNDRSLMAQAVEESIRWESPLLITSRLSMADSVVGGVEIPAGTQVVPNIGSGNHDETRWDHGDDFDIFRPVIPHISFGVGPHMCLGMHLARMEMDGAVNALLDRCPNLRLDPDAVERDDPHIHGERFRSPTSLPVLFG